jgi:hypothetical protein
MTIDCDLGFRAPDGNREFEANQISLSRGLILFTSRQNSETGSLLESLPASSPDS